MGVRFLEDTASGATVMYCPTTGVAFGPVFEDKGEVRAFLDWLKRDPRLCDDIMAEYGDWKAMEAGDPRFQEDK